MSTLEIAQITGGVYENLEQKQSFVAMRSYAVMLCIHLLCGSYAPERDAEASHGRNMEGRFTDVLNTVNCCPGYLKKKCQSRNACVCFSVR
jgi:hypothetical protein